MPPPDPVPQDDTDSFTGKYEVAGTLTLSDGTKSETVPLAGASIAISKSTDSRLALDLGGIIGGCSLGAQVANGTAFNSDAGQCPTSIQCSDTESGTVTFKFSPGSGTVAGKGLTWTSKGLANIKCPDEQGGDIQFGFELKGDKK